MFGYACRVRGERTGQRRRDELAANYDPKPDNYRLSDDPRCLWGWGGCGHLFGHSCFRALGHPGRCVDSGTYHRPADRMPCETSQRPRNWDDTGRKEANQ